MSCHLMSLSIYVPSCLTGALVVVGSCFLSTANLNAQAPESRSTRFVPASTYAAMSLNMRAILKRVDLDDPLIAMLSQLPHIDTGFLDDPRLARSVTMFPSRVEENAHPASPCGVLMQYEAPATPKAFFNRMRLSKYSQFTKEDYKAQQIHVRRWSQGIRKGRESKVVWFFPEENVVASGTRHVVQQMIDGDSAKSGGKEVVSSLNPKAELHFILEGNDKVGARMMASMFGHFDPLPARPFGEALQDAKRAEVLFSYAEKVPIQVTIEMKDAESMDRLMELIKVGVAEAPGILDALEEHEIPREEKAQPPFRELIALGRTAVQELKVERDGTTLRMTLGHVAGLEKLPQAYLTWSMIQAAGSGP